jgi:hypothetical protein
MPISFLFAQTITHLITFGEPLSKHPKTPLQEPSRRTSKMYNSSRELGLPNSAKLDSVHGNFIVDVLSL